MRMTDEEISALLKVLTKEQPSSEMLQALRTFINRSEELLSVTREKRAKPNK